MNTSSLSGSVGISPCLFTVSAEEKLNGWNSALIGVGLVFFFTGLSFAITVGVILGLKIKKCGGMHV